MSYRDQQLEYELELTPLARTSSSVVMTQADEEFYHYITSMLERANEAGRAIRGRRRSKACESNRLPRHRKLTLCSG
jgi:DNA-binding transcriptional LysR family regulator